MPVHLTPYQRPIGGGRKGRVAALLAAAVCFPALSMGILAACSPSEKPPADTYRGAITGNIKSFDPAHAGDENTNTIQYQVYEALYQYHYLSRPYDVEPLLAAAMPIVSDSGLTYTVALRTDVYFQDDPCFPQGHGRKLSAHDFVYSLKRLADVRTQTTGWWVLEGKILGLDAWRQASESLPPLPDTASPPLYAQPVAGLEAWDDSTVIIRLTHPYPYFKYLLAMPYLALVAKEAVLHYGQEFLNHPVGTGPYRLTEWRRNLRLRFERNENFHSETYPREGESGDSAVGLMRDAGRVLPLIAKLDFGIFEESQPMWLNFLRGRLDRSGIPKDNYAEAVMPNKRLRQDLEAKGIDMVKLRELYTGYIAFNLKDTLLGRAKALRQAMALAYDVEESIETFSNGRGIRAQSPIPPGLFGYDSAYVSPYGRFDLEAAEKKLAEAGYAGGKGLPDFEYLAVSGTGTRQLGEHFAQCMRRLGIRVNLVAATWPEYLDRMKKGKFQIVRAAWGADYPDPENFLMLLYGPNEPPGENNASYHNPVYDSLYRRMAVMQDSPERLALVHRMRDIAAEDCPWILVNHRLAETLIQGRLRNVKLNAVMSAPIKYYGLESGTP